MDRKAALICVSLFLAACSGSGGGFSSAGATTNNNDQRELFAFPDRFFLGQGFAGQLARGDLNGDGVVDVAVPLTDSSGRTPPSVVLAYLDRHGHPKKTVQLADAREPREVVLSDCNGDRRADVLVLDDHGEVESGEVLVYLQEANGAFALPLHVAVGVEPIRLFAARWDADRTLDLLTVNQAGHSVCVLPGHGDGTFGPARFTDHGVLGVRFADAGDLDQDGALDLALVHSYGGFVLFGSGDGGFGTPQSLPTGSGDVGVRVAELTGDGSPDIVLTNCNGLGLRVLEGDGAGSFAPGFTLAGCFYDIATGDLDRDDRVDLVLVSNDGITPLLGQGDGGFARGPRFSPGVSSADLALWDADGDLDVDLVSVVSTVDSRGRTLPRTDLALLMGKGEGSFEGPGEYTTGYDGRALAVGDFVRDGVPDLAVLDYPPALWVVRGAGDGAFGARRRTPLAAGGVSLACADLDGNTLEDLLVATNFSADELVLLSSTGAGTFDSLLPFPSGGREPQTVRVADLDSDLLPDLVVSLARSNAIAVHLGVLGGFSQPTLFGVEATPVDVELSDLDADGNLDAAVTNHGAASASVLIGNGDGTFLPASTVPAFDLPWGLEIGDFDGDGIDDLAIACVAEIALLAGKGDGTFAAPRPLVPDMSESVFELIAADLNRDGVLDLVTASRFAVFVQLANGAGGYERPRTFMTNAGTGGMQVRDLDADGKMDLVVVAGPKALVFLDQSP